MKCKYCEDVGELFVPGRIIKCPYCQSVTNEERMRTCSTEELATVIYGIAMYDTLYDRIHNAFVLNPCEDDSAGINEVVRWLKEIHE